MTVATQGGGQELSAYGDFEDSIGLEDVGVGDVSLPRIKIRHTEGKFENTLSGEVMDHLDAILLGLVKQRVMWHKEVDDGDLPMCKSPDFEHGFPLVESDKQPRDKFFPWPKSNFNSADYPPEKGINGLTTLPCNSCIFSMWEKGDHKQPPCAEQHMYPLLYTTDDWHTFQPGMIHFQKSGIKPSRNYLSSFVSSKRPLFTVKTRITLDVTTRGQVTYSTPKLVRVDESDREQWKEYGDMYRRVREFARSAPTGPSGDEEEATSPQASDNSNTAPTQQAPATPPPTQQAAPAQQAPATPPPAQQAAPAETAPPASSETADEDMPF